MNRPRDEEGFTLLELMVVVAIIAIIASILVPNFFHARAQAAVSACESNIRSIATAAELYYTDNQSYPTSGAVDTNFSLYTGHYLTQIPHDPAAQGAAVAGTTAAPYTFTQANAAGGAQGGYTILCPGLHQASALAGLSGGANLQTDSAIGYGSSTGFQVGAAPATQ